MGPGPIRVTSTALSSNSRAYIRIPKGMRLPLGNLDVSLRFHAHPLTPCTIQVGGSPMVSAMLPALASAWGGVCNLRGAFRGVRWHLQ
jgi:hypothetical protein